MKPQDYRAFVEQLSDLTVAQRDRLLAALKSEGSAAQVISMIERRFAARPSCGHCGSEQFSGWGTASGLKR